MRNSQQSSQLLSYFTVEISSAIFVTDDQHSKLAGNKAQAPLILFCCGYAVPQTPQQIEQLECELNPLRPNSANYYTLPYRPNPRF